MYACVNSADPGCQYLLQALVIMLKGIHSHLLNQHAELFTSLSNTILVEERYSRSAPPMHYDNGSSRPPSEGHA